MHFTWFQLKGQHHFWNTLRTRSWKSRLGSWNYSEFSKKKKDWVLYLKFCTYFSVFLIQRIREEKREERRRRELEKKRQREEEKRKRREEERRKRKEAEKQKKLSEKDIKIKVSNNFLFQILDFDVVLPARLFENHRVVVLIIIMMFL